jgi:hypothetical protein
MVFLMTQLEKRREICIDAGRCGYDLIGSAGITTSAYGFEDESVLVATLLARTLSNMKAAILLLDEKRIVEARIMTRCCVENSFWVAGLIEEGQDFAERMISDEQKRSSSRTQYMIDGQFDMEPSILDRLRSWMRNNEKYKNEKTLSPKTVSKLSADFERFYLFYSILSNDAAHSSISALKRYAVKNTDGRFSGLDLEPEISIEEVDSTYQILSSAVITTLLGSVEVFTRHPGMHGMALLTATMKVQAVAQRHMALCSDS